MKMKFILVFLTILFATQVRSQRFDFTYKGQTLTYEITDVEGKTCCVYKNPDKEGIVVIPELATLENIDYSVTSICEYAFENCSNLTSVIIPASVQTVGNQAFNKCSGLQKNLYPSFLDNPFPNNRGITKNISYDPGDVSIEDGIFYNQSKTLIIFVPIDFDGEFEIQESVTKIDDYAFFNCVGLTAVRKGNSVQSVGNYSFYECSRLELVELGNSLTSIGDDAFSFCDQLTSMDIEFKNIKTIGDGAFFGCPALSSLDLESITYIGNRAFYDCNALTSVIIGDSIETIGEEAFKACRNLSSLVLGKSVKQIGDGAFSMCYGLTSLVLDNSIETIGADAFNSCKNLNSLKIGDSVKYIGRLAFRYCLKLTYLEIGASVETIDEYAFCENDLITSVICKSENPIEGVNSNIFDQDVYDKATLYVPSGALEAYKDLLPWSLFNNISAEDPNAVDSVEDFDTMTGGNSIDGVFDMNGRLVSESYTDHLTKGCYIITHKGNVRKVIVE